MDKSILVQTSNKNRNRIFAYEVYLDILRDGTWWHREDIGLYILTSQKHTTGQPIKFEGTALRFYSNFVDDKHEYQKNKHNIN